MKPNFPFGRTAASAGLCAVVTLSSVISQAESDIEEVVVTGQKVSRSLQDTPDSVAVMTELVMEEQQILGMNDALEQTPNVAVQPGTSFTIRGIDAFNVSGGGNSYLASVYLDGAPLPYRMIQNGGFSTWDLSQVEVLRGPQSSLQGRNALAGAIVARSQDTSYDWNAKARLIGGEYGKKEMAVAAGGGLVDDLLSFRISGERKQFDGFNENIVTGKGSDYQDLETYRLKVKLEPTENLDIIWGYTYYDEETGVPFTNTPPAGHSTYDYRVLDYNSPTFESNRADLFTQEIIYDLGEHWQLSSITSYSDSNYAYEWDGDASNNPPDLVQVDDRTDETLSQEFRAVFNYDRFNGVIGAYYSDLEVNDEAQGQRILSFAEVGVTPPSLAAIFGVSEAEAAALLSLYAPVDPVELGVTSDFYQKVTTAAVFADMTYSLTSKLDFLFGLRWDYEKQENSANSVYTIDNFSQFPNPSDYSAVPAVAGAISQLNGFILAQADAASGEEPLSDADFNEWLPKVGISYRWTDDLTTSFVIKQGYRSGGVGTNVARASNFVYDPEYLTNYELSLRSVWLDGRLIANANAFYNDWKDQQVSVRLSANQFDTETRNAGKSNIKGFEFELQYYATENLKLYSGFGYAKTEFTDFEVGGVDLSGRAFPYAPEWTGNIGATWSAGNGLFANINANYVDKSKPVVDPSTTGFSPGDPGYDADNDSRTVVNLKLGYQWDNMGVYLVGTNVLDEEYLVDADTGLGQQTYGAPQQWSLSLEASY
ncbi:TonB-dependent receptor [Pseudomaricurvus sp.]|uniref:TonB-dependent receptor n=1 Tax=Pseudomaricurvus sp. TaxID=2004510 RepID=UPI003F6C0CE7